MCLILVNDNNFQIKVNFLVTKYQDAAPGSTVLQEQKNMISLGYTFSIVCLIAGVGSYCSQVQTPQLSVLYLMVKLKWVSHVSTQKL